MNILGIIIIFIFGILWTYIINNVLPSNITDIKNRKSERYDEQQKMMFAEIFARSLVWLIYFVLTGLIMRLLNMTDNSKNLFLKFPELTILIATLVLLVVNYFIVKRKYAAKD